MEVEIKLEKVLESPQMILPKFTEVYSTTTEELPVDGTEVVAWMQKAGAINHICSDWYNDYSMAGGSVEGSCNDGWYPGVFTTNYQVFARQTGDAVKKDGYVRVDNRYGQEVARCPPFRRAFFDAMKGLVIVTDTFGVQHLTLLAEFRRYVRLPFRGTMRVPSILVARRGYISLPAVFLADYPPIPSPMATFLVDFEASEPGELVCEIYTASGTLAGRGVQKCDEGRHRAFVTVRGNILGSNKVVLAYDKAERGFVIYEVRSIFPPTLP